MAKKPEFSDQPGITAETTPPATNGSGGRLPKSKLPRKERKTPSRARKNAEQKQKSAEPEISDDAIRLRAYFIAEERMRKSIAGDPQSDWIEARRQLLAELNQG
ncbi:MAG TPA: DUF2934 domain-containing protein [Chthoniobacterales bacterium]